MSFLRRLFRPSLPAAPSGPSAPERQNALAMVLLRDADGLDFAGLLEAVRDRGAKVGEWETGDAAATPLVPGGAPELAAATARIPGGKLSLLVMPAPIPAGDLEGPVQLAWHWPQAAEAVAEHTAHIIVFAGSTELDALDTHLLVTRTIGAILEHADALGVYVGDATLIRSAADYAEDAASGSRWDPPLLCWIGFNLVKESDGLSAYTTGLAGFGFLELEARKSRLPFAELLGRLGDVAKYQISTGTAIGDGETFGASETDVNQVRYRPSTFLPNTRVALIEFQ